MEKKLTFEEYLKMHSDIFSCEGCASNTFHDADTIYLEELEFNYDYKNKNPIRNCLNLYLRYMGTNADIVSFYNYSIHKGGLPPVFGLWSYYEFSQLSNDKQLLSIDWYGGHCEIAFRDCNSFLLNERQLSSILKKSTPPAISIRDDTILEWSSFSGTEIFQTREQYFEGGPNTPHPIKNCISCQLNCYEKAKTVSFYNYEIRYGALPPMHSTWKADQFELFRKKSKRGEKYHLHLDFTLPNGNEHYLDILFEHFEITEPEQERTTITNFIR